MTIDDLEKAANAAGKAYGAATRKFDVLADLLRKFHAIDGDCDDAMDARYGAVVDVKWIQQAVDTITTRLAREIVAAEAEVEPLGVASEAAFRAFDAACEAEEAARAA